MKAAGLIPVISLLGYMTKKVGQELLDSRMLLNKTAHELMRHTTGFSIW